MKTENEMTKKSLKFWISIGVVFIVLINITHLSYELDRQFEWHLMVIRVIISVLTFYFTYLFSKNKKFGFLFIPVFLLMFAPPFLVGKLDFVYFLLSFARAFTSFCNAIVVYLAANWFFKQKRAQELEKKNLQSELSMLKNQLNPHFLFNTLNNIDSLIKKNPDRASQSIVELSDMMRYMIYETNVKKVPLAKELEYIDNYLALQKLQYFNDDLVEYTVSGNPEGIEIAPMLFIPFIENAFKHCTDKERRHAIRFSFAIDTDKIRFSATNIADKNHTISKDETSGIGLETVKRRLEILYPNRYLLGIEEKNELFCVVLEIEH